MQTDFFKCYKLDVTNCEVSSVLVEANLAPLLSYLCVMYILSIGVNVFLICLFLYTFVVVLNRSFFIVQKLIFSCQTTK